MLELKNISYFYKSQKDKMVLDQISYQFEKGKMYAILGTSGSGKTTLLSLLAGLDSPISGEIDMNGENIEEKGLAREGLMEEAERFSVPDDLKDKIMKKIKKQNN